MFSMMSSKTEMESAWLCLEAPESLMNCLHFLATRSTLLWISSERLCSTLSNSFFISSFMSRSRWAIVSPWAIVSRIRWASVSRICLASFSCSLRALRKSAARASFSRRRLLVSCKRLAAASFSRSAVAFPSLQTFWYFVARTSFSRRRSDTLLLTRRSSPHRDLTVSTALFSRNVCRIRSLWGPFSVSRNALIMRLRSPDHVLTNCMCLKFRMSPLESASRRFLPETSQRSRFWSNVARRIPSRRPMSCSSSRARAAVSPTKSTLLNATSFRSIWMCLRNSSASVPHASAGKRMAILYSSTALSTASRACASRTDSHAVMIVGNPPPLIAETYLCASWANPRPFTGAPSMLLTGAF